eukprot:NODE_35_length_36362_cov_0.944434.p30 type:complete len:128 gc:universal NODE_35_length_36362_cov_0.944434:35469-35086(-)
MPCEVTTPSRHYIQVGRVVYLSFEKKFGVISDIIDQNFGLIGGIEYYPKKVKFTHLELTPIVLDIPRALRSGILKKKLEAAKFNEKIKETALYKRHVKREKRENLTDFDRFKVRSLKKQKRLAINKK